MSGHRLRLTAALNVLATFVVAVWPGNALAQCGCGPDGCGANATTGCCSAPPKPQAALCCEAPRSAPQHCCCIANTPATCSHEAANSAELGCECSPARPAAPAQPSAPDFGSKVISTSALPLWAETLPDFNLSTSPSLLADVALHAPPIPLRELYCVWRI